MGRWKEIEPLITLGEEALKKIEGSKCKGIKIEIVSYQDLFDNIDTYRTFLKTSDEVHLVKDGLAMMTARYVNMVNKWAEPILRNLRTRQSDPLLTLDKLCRALYGADKISAYNGILLFFVISCNNCK